MESLWLLTMETLSLHHELKNKKTMTQVLLASTEQIRIVVEEAIQKHLYNNVSALETEKEDILSPKDVCKLLKVSPKTLQTLRDERRIPFCQSGRKIWFLRSDVIHYVNKNRIDSRR